MQTISELWYGNIHPFEQFTYGDKRIKELMKPAWMFSREMPGWMEKSWLNYIMAGSHHVKAYEDRNGAKYYKVTQDAKFRINEHYSNKWFLYRDDYSNKLEDLLVSMEDSVRKYGTKLLILTSVSRFINSFTKRLVLMYAAFILSLSSNDNFEKPVSSDISSSKFSSCFNNLMLGG